MALSGRGRKRCGLAKRPMRAMLVVESLVIVRQSPQMGSVPNQRTIGKLGS